MNSITIKKRIKQIYIFLVGVFVLSMFLPSFSNPTDPYRFFPYKSYASYRQDYPFARLYYGTPICEQDDSYLQDNPPWREPIVNQAGLDACHGGWLRKPSPGSFADIVIHIAKITPLAPVVLFFLALGINIGIIGSHAIRRFYRYQPSTIFLRYLGIFWLNNLIIAALGFIFYSIAQTAGV
jgi:hypothetical protein